MKIFVNGSRNVKQDIPALICNKIDKYMESSDVFLLSGNAGIDMSVQKYLSAQKYDKVTLYFSGDRKHKTNMGGWNEEHCPVGFKSTSYKYYIEKDFAMAEDADEGIIIWDGESKSQFVNMLNLVILGKYCNLYLLKEDRWIEIRGLEDLSEYVGKCGGWDISDTEEILTKCGFSIEMKTYMMEECRINDYTLVDIICYAPISLIEKTEILAKLYQKRNIKSEIFQSINLIKNKEFKDIKKEIRKIISNESDASIWRYIDNAYKTIGKALNTLKNSVYYDEYVFSLHSEWYDTDVFIEKSSSAGLFRDVGQVIKYIENEEKENETGEGWYRIEVWTGFEDELTLVYNFYTIGKEICWFECMTPYQDDLGNIYYRAETGYYNSGLRLDFYKTPYKSGELVRIDCRPFGPMFNAMILEEDYSTILFKFPYTNEWSITSLKSGRFFKDADCKVFWTPLSAIYRVRYVDNDEELDEFSKMILDNSILGKEIYEKWDQIGDEFKTSEGVKILIKNILIERQ